MEAGNVKWGRLEDYIDLKPLTAVGGTGDDKAIAREVLQITCNGK